MQKKYIQSLFQAENAYHEVWTDLDFRKVSPTGLNYIKSKWILYIDYIDFCFSDFIVAALRDFKIRLL